MADDIGEALDFLIGAGQGGGAVAHHVLQAGVDGGHLLARVLNLADIAPHHPGREQRKDQDQQAGDGVHHHGHHGGALGHAGPFGDARGLEGVEIVDGLAQLVHIAFAFAGPHRLDRLAYAALTRQGQGRLHLPQLGVGEPMDLGHRRPERRVGRRAFFEKRQGRLALRARLLKGRQEIAAAGQQKAALRGLRIQHGDQDRARLAAHLLGVFDRIVNRGGALYHDEGRDVDRQQQDEGQDQQAGDGSRQGGRAHKIAEPRPALARGKFHAAQH